MNLEFNVEPEWANKSLLTFLRRGQMLSATLVRRLKRAAAIQVDGLPRYTNYILSPGQHILVDLSKAEPESDLVPETGPLSVLYEDQGLFAVNKPPGLLTHPSHSRYTGTLSNFAAGYLLGREEGAVCHGVNRLDRDTSGLVLFGKNCYMKERASAALAQSGEKSYLGLVYGLFPHPEGRIDLPIRRQTEGNQRRIVAPDGQRAVTHYRVLGQACPDGQAVSLVRFTLETGRTHQIRAHCLALGCPLLGDCLYHSPLSLAFSQAHGLSAQLLHACRLRFLHPITGQALTLTAPVEREDMASVLRLFPAGWESL